MAIPKSNFKDSHRSYYDGVSGPIGGDDRFDWVAKKFFPDVRGKRILEIGCGEGSLLKKLSEGGNEVHGIDISESGVEKTRQKGIVCHHIDASNEPIPYADGHFDVVITLETIEHVENPHAMIWEMKRVLKENGTLLISIPGERVYHPFIYPGLFTHRNFSEFLESNALEIKSVEGWGQAPLLSHWSKNTRDKGSRFWNAVADIVFFIGRKRNLLMRKRTGTPLRWAYCVNYECLNRRKAVSRVEQVARQTTPV